MRWGVVAAEQTQALDIKYTLVIYSYLLNKIPYKIYIYYLCFAETVSDPDEWFEKRVKFTRVFRSTP